MRRYGPGIGVFILTAVLGWGFLCAAQVPGSSTRLPPPGTPPSPPPSMTDQIDGAGPHEGITASMREQMEKARNQDRQKQLVEDTQKLLTLATELKTDVDKTNKDTLSVDVIRKADEIEKLAHSVKEKMKGS